MPTAPFQVGVAGYGFGGKVFHATLIDACRDLELAAVCTRSDDRRRAAEADFGCLTYGHYDELVTDPNLDLIAISVPNDLHAPFAIQAMQAGKSVVIDKPICLTAREAEALIRVRDDTGMALVPYQNSRFDNDFLTLRRVVEQGLLGDLLIVEAAWTRYGTGRSTYRAEKARGGGPLYDFGPHFLDQALVLLGREIDTVYADLIYSDPAFDIEMSAHVWVRFKSGARFGMEAGYITRLPKPRWLVRGTIGTLTRQSRDSQEQHMIRGQAGPQPDPPQEWATVATVLDGLGTTMRIESVTDQSYLTLYENVADVLAGKAEQLITAEEALDTARLIDAAFQSAETGEVVRLGQ